MRGPARKPSNILKASGAFTKNPSRGRARADEPEVRGELGEPPERMTEAQREYWNELKGYMHLGVCAENDRPAFTTLVFMYEALWKSDCEVSVMVAFLKALAYFGMTPADRSRVKVTNKPKVDDPWDEFGGKK